MNNPKPHTETSKNPRAMKQKIWQPLGWRVMLTWRHTFGLGFQAASSWRALRINGVDLFVGPYTMTLQPPMPKYMESDHHV